MWKEGEDIVRCWCSVCTIVELIYHFNLKQYLEQTLNYHSFFISRVCNWAGPQCLFFFVVTPAARSPAELQRLQAQWFFWLTPTECPSQESFCSGDLGRGINYYYKYCCFGNSCQGWCCSSHNLSIFFLLNMIVLAVGQASRLKIEKVLDF